MSWIWDTACSKHLSSAPPGDRPGKPGILVTEDLTPAEVANLQTGTVLGVICLQGGKTSHAAILLRARGVPAIARAESFFEPNDNLSEGSTVVAFDGESGELWLNPAADALRELRKRKEKFDHETKRVARLSHKPAVTKDGTPCPSSRTSATPPCPLPPGDRAGNRALQNGVPLRGPK
jgi:phosphoenolpyruvate-protein kinase (PTS system EI component)